MKRFNCCFPKCKYKHESLLCVIDHMAKVHNLNVNYDSSRKDSLNLNKESSE